MYISCTNKRRCTMTIQPLNPLPIVSAQGLEVSYAANLMQKCLAKKACGLSYDADRKIFTILRSVYHDPKDIKDILDRAGYYAKVAPLNITLSVLKERDPDGNLLARLIAGEKSDALLEKHFPAFSRLLRHEREQGIDTTPISPLELQLRNRIRELAASLGN